MDERSIFTEVESQARSYCRSFPVIFDRAQGSYLYDLQGQAYIDFLSCAGSVNYGHNPAVVKTAMIDYLQDDGIQGALDMHSRAKQAFIYNFRKIILEPRALAYKMQFTSPTGTSVVESAIKLARKVTGRRHVVSFTNGFHGMSGTSLGLTGSRDNRQPGVDPYVFRLPYENYLPGLDTIAYFERLLNDNSSGLDLPAAVILETVQGEGGINIASAEWLRRLRQLTAEHDILLIVDDIQAGCGRTGTFFSFEPSGITPDMVCLSKSLSGYALPFALLLHRPELDQWRPGEDNGTFRGNSLAFVAATRTLQAFWCDELLVEHIKASEAHLQAWLGTVTERFAVHIKAVRGRGLFYGIEFHEASRAAAVMRACFERHLIIERCGPEDQVLKLMPALTIETSTLQMGLQRIFEAMQQVLSKDFDTPRTIREIADVN
ncbi:diaminobutyrate--2-oxoglutarate transaminase [Pseudomonas sp. 3A(2025)]